jgi:hypothetical protein
LSTSTWLKEKRRLALTTTQHYGDINDDKEEEDRGKGKSFKVYGKDS